MSAEAARIISKISGRKQTSGFEPMLGTVSAISPLTVKFDDVGFDVSAGLLVNSSFMGHKRKGDITSPVMDLPDLRAPFLQEIELSVLQWAAHTMSYYVRWCLHNGNFTRVIRKNYGRYYHKNV